MTAIDPDLLPKLLRRACELELTCRASDLLKGDGIVYVGDLVLKSEVQLLHIRRLGRRTLGEIKEALARMGLHLGMDVPGWPPENVDELAKRFEDHY
jgi:DNA-directed RNA polymerase subunit alpha